MSQDQSNTDILAENAEDQEECVWHVTLRMRWELGAPDYPRRQVYVRARPESLEVAAARGLRIPVAFAINPREVAQGIRFIVIAHDVSVILMPIIAWLLNEPEEDLESGMN